MEYHVPDNYDNCDHKMPLPDATITSSGPAGTVRAGGTTGAVTAVATVETVG